MLRSYFRRKFDRCGIENANLYSFRHTFVTLCHLAEIPAKYVQYWAGHSDMNLTLNTYTHILRKGTSPFFEYIKGLKSAVDYESLALPAEPQKHTVVATKYGAQPSLFILL